MTLMQKSTKEKKNLFSESSSASLYQRRASAYWQETPLDLYSHLPCWWSQNRAKTDVFAFNEREYHITTSWKKKNNVCELE